MPAIEFIHPVDRDRLCAGGCEPTPLSERRLDQITMQLHAAHSVAEVFAELVEHLAPDLPFDRLGLALLTADGTRVVSRRVYSSHPTVLWGPGTSAPLLGSSLEPLLREGAIRIIHDLCAYQQLRPSSVPTHRLIEEGMRSSLTIPLYDGKTPLGFLFATSGTPHAYTPQHVAVAAVLAPTLGHALAEALERELDIGPRGQANPTPALPKGCLAMMSDQGPRPG
ncbi:MAG TPA: GAF domain-containing protein [Stenomitos sp.]